MEIFVSSDINYQIESPVFKVNKSNGYIDQVSYVDSFGQSTRRYIQKPHFYSTISHKKEDEVIFNAAYTLCRLNPREFCSLYRLVQSESIRAILDSVLEKIKQDYLVKSTYAMEYSLPNPYSIGESYIIGAGFPSVVTESVTFKVGESHNLLSVVGKSRDIESRKIIPDFEYGKMLCEGATATGCLTEAKCMECAKILCQSSLDEYQRLLEYLDCEDPFYNSVKGGLEDFQRDIQVAENTIKSR